MTPKFLERKCSTLSELWTSHTRSLKSEDEFGFEIPVK